MMRFYVDKKENDYFVLSEEELKHIKVARVQSKEFICVYEEKFYICVLENNLAKIKEILNEDHEYRGEVILAAAIIDKDRFRWLVEKATELGATKLIPLYSKNVEKKSAQKIEEKIEKWNKVALSAAKQSFRNKPMIVEQPMDFKEAIKLELKNKYIAHEKENQLDLENFFPTDSIFFIGPEGGFTDEEVKQAEDEGAKIISLGKRILRAETASIYVLSNIKEKL